MKKQAYLFTTADALRDLSIAMEEAKALLPDDVLRKHYVKVQTSPDPWNASRYAYEGRADYDPEIAAVLLHLWLLSGALANLKTVTQRQPDKPPDTSLPRRRRTP